MNVVQGESMADTFYRFHHAPEQQRRFGARGGKTTARNRRRARMEGGCARSLDTASTTVLHVETTAAAIAALDAQFPWLRGAEIRLRANSSARLNTHRTRALTAE